jgi:signal transduction histidine kinase
MSTPFTDETTGSVLVVDDDPVALYRKSRMLRAAGFDTIEASDGHRALELVEQLKPRVVVLDVQLPGLDGWTVCKRIKSNPETASVLVLQVSATFVTESDTVRSLEQGADACLTEPIEAPVLVATVRALIRARRAEDALRDALDREQSARAAAEASQIEAEAANRTKDEFLAILSHELRSPLSAILTWTTLLRSGGLDANRGQRALESIDRNARLQKKLIEDLLDVSRIISGKLSLELGWVDLAALAREALEAAQLAAEAQGVRVEREIADDLRPVRADGSRLLQVLNNLMSNAVKFTPRGGVVALRIVAEGPWARIEVRDSGKGIEPAFLPHLFERFRQADASTTRREGGLGLGLAIVRHLVEMHGGTVTAQSEGPDRGSVFTVRLAMPETLAPSAESARRPRAPRSEAPASLAGMRVLVVDDDADGREAVVVMLERAGARVREAPSARAALAALADEPPHVIVSDIGMPQEDGYEFMRRVRALGPESGGDLPAVAMTAYARNEDRARVFEAGYQAYLAKPLDAGDLIATLLELAGDAVRSGEPAV